MNIGTFTNKDTHIGTGTQTLRRFTYMKTAQKVSLKFYMVLVMGYVVWPQFFAFT